VTFNISLWLLSKSFALRRGYGGAFRVGSKVADTALNPSEKAFHRGFQIIFPFLLQNKSSWRKILKTKLTFATCVCKPVANVY
jgi:hypothetical protein